MSFTSIDLELDELFRDRDRRNAFFRSITQDEIASQIRAVRKTRQLTQNAFAVLSGMKQSAISRIEQADYAAWNLTTLFRVAEALDSRWKVILQPAEEAVKEFLSETDEDAIEEGAAAKAAKAASDASLTNRNAPPIDNAGRYGLGRELAQ
jgi:transcriptional regulator with XRE-family HTH domain